MTTPTGMQNSLSIAERRRLRQQEQEAARAKQAAAEQGITGPPDAARMDLSKIIRNPENPRDDLSEVEELAASIREVGVTQAITLIPASTFVAAYPEHAETVNGFPYVVVNGNRRHRASELAEETDIPFTVNTRATTRVDIATVALVENVHRVDLTPMEEARTVAELKEVYGRAALVAKRLSKSEGWVSQRLKLMNLTDEFQSEVESGKLLVEDARVLGRAKPEDQPVVREELRAKRAAKKAAAPRKAKAEAEAKPVPQPVVPSQPQPADGGMATAADTGDSGLQQNSEETSARRAACQLVVSAGDEGDDTTAVLVAAMLRPVPAAEAQALAREWLSEEDDSTNGPDFAIVLSGSDYTPGRRTAALALALAHCELHTASQAQDESVRAYLQWLAKYAGYSPTASERDFLNAAAATA
ncbi:ParB/RepB/Spo0J family partition protein (plasmid) [Streptomyces sp. NBC_01278]|uniref:ParB/RepB/Spo0J family partition protein n=1 Tax=Streptomyces sp. NBC_01278 TaxID=2903809 RepID=UPI002E33E41F|nr:ParB/RepB/Spo0J family partition protein [Streptomyces sp. NBC_01278]